MAYTPTTWANGPAGGTPINATALNKIEQGILDTATAGVVESPANSGLFVPGIPATNLALAKASNLSDLANISIARGNLGLAIGTTAGTVAAGDDSRFGVVSGVTPLPPVPAVGLPVLTAPLRTVNVTNRATLDAAIADVRWGDKIVLAAGSYGSSGADLVFTSPASLVGYTPDNPVPGVWIKGAAALASLVDRGALTTGYALHLDKANYMVIDGLKILGGQKGVMADETSYARLVNCNVGNVGHEAVHFRNYSSSNTIDTCTLHDTGMADEAYGEACYFGQSVNNWNASFSRTGGAMDTSDYNIVQNCTMYEIAAECVDAKEGTIGGFVRNNTMAGKAISGVNSADSYVDIKGNGYLIEGNVCTVPSAKVVHGMSTHILYSGFGSNNVFKANSVIAGGQTTGAENSANGGAQGYNIQTSGSRGSATGNIVYSDNTSTATPGGLSNIPTTDTTIVGGGTSTTYVTLTGGQTIAGLKNFTTAPTINGAAISGGGGIPQDSLLWNAKDHGVKGDGATVDSAALQTLINSVTALGGGMVYLPAGTYVIANVYLASNITLAGAGMGATILLMDPTVASGGVVIRVANGSNTAASYVTVRDLTIDGNKAAWGAGSAQKGYGYYLGSGVGYVTDCYVDHVEFRNCKTYACDMVNSKRVQITDCTSHDNGYPGGTMNNCSGFEVLGDDITITNCRSFGNANKGFISGESAVVHYRTKFVACTAEANAFEGFFLHDNLADSAIMGGASRDNLGAGVTLTGATTHCSVVGVDITGNAGNGLRFDSATWNVASACIINGNATASTGNPEMYFTSGAAHNSVVGCIINSTKATSAISESTGCDYQTLRGVTVQAGAVVLTGAGSTNT